MVWLEILRLARSMGASDVHLSTGEAPWLRVDGRMQRMTSLDFPAFTGPLRALDVLKIIEQLQIQTSNADEFVLNSSRNARYNNLDFAVSLPKLGRFRVNAFKQARGPALAMRLISDSTPHLDQLLAPSCVRSWGSQSHGLVLITGPTGSGKSTLLAALVQDINARREGHILTLEDPIEFVHTANQCLIHQREVGRDTPDFESGLRAGLREDPDVILVGEMRDTATIRLALTAAETGHLVLSTLHTASAPQAIDRLVDAFPANEKEGVRALLAESLIAVLAQTLCPAKGGAGRVAAHEIMVGTPAVKNLIREGKVSQLYSLLQTGQAVGMQTLDQSLLHLYRAEKISAATLQLLSKYPQNLNLVDNLKPERSATL